MAWYICIYIIYTYTYIFISTFGAQLSHERVNKREMHLRCDVRSVHFHRHRVIYHRELTCSLHAVYACVTMRNIRVSRWKDFAVRWLGVFNVSTRELWEGRREGEGRKRALTWWLCSEFRSSSLRVLNIQMNSGALEIHRYIRVQ